MIKIIVDCYGGDHSPQANIDGAISALADLDNSAVADAGRFA